MFPEKMFSLTIMLRLSGFSASSDRWSSAYSDASAGMSLTQLCY